MLSDDLQSLAEKLKTYAGSSLNVTPGGIASLCRILESAAEDARALENSVVRQPCIRVLAKQNTGVVDLHEERGRRDIENWLRGQGVYIINTGPDGGDAA